MPTLVTDICEDVLLLLLNQTKGRLNSLLVERLGVESPHCDLSEINELISILNHLERELKRVRSQQPSVAGRKIPKYRRVQKRAHELIEERRRDQGNDCRIITDRILDKVADEFGEKLDRIKAAYYYKPEKKKESRVGQNSLL